jgi:hypothetical protein
VTGYPAIAPLSAASLIPYSIAGINSLGITPPLIELKNRSPLSLSPAFNSTMQCPNCPTPPFL